MALDQRNQSRQSLAVTVNSQLEADMASTIRSGLHRFLFSHSSNRHPYSLFFFSPPSSPTSLQEEMAKQRAKLLQEIKSEMDKQDEWANQVVEQYTSARNNPALLNALLQHQTELQQQELAISIAKQASRQAAIQALEKERQEHDIVANAVTLRMADAQVIALQQLSECQKMVNKAMDSYVNEVERARQERGYALEEVERQNIMLGE